MWTTQIQSWKNVLIHPILIGFANEESMVPPNKGTSECYPQVFWQLFESFKQNTTISLRRGLKYNIIHISKSQGHVLLSEQHLLKSMFINW